jgi:hypothetical protein
MTITSPTYVIQAKKEICSNAKEVLASIQKALPDETYEKIAKRAGVHMQTIQRWSAVGRSNAKAMRILVASFEKEESYENILLRDASPKQLKKQCQKIGWDKVINSSD